MFRRIIKLLKQKGGVATSLLEATATIAVGATLAGAAITVVTDKVQQARIAATAQDVQMIGDAINNFEKDNGFYPIFSSARSASSSINDLTAPDVTEGGDGAHGTSRTNVDILESANGDEPELDTEAGGVGEDINDNSFGGSTGHNSAAADDGWDSQNSDTIESQLSENGPGYVVRGGFDFDPKRGYNGPYMAKVPPTDAWGNKFKVNALYLDDHRVFDATTNDAGNPFMTFILSAGPNEKIQSDFEVTKANIGTAIRGDDILFRVR